MPELKKTDDGTPIAVIPAEQVEAKLATVKTEQESLTAKVAQLMAQMQSDQAATGVALDQRKDDLARYARAVEELTAEVSKLKQTQAGRREGAMSASMAELRDDIVMLQGGFWEVNGNDHDKENVERPAAAKLEARHFIEGVQVPGRGWWAPENKLVRELQKLNDQVVVANAVMANGPHRDAYSRAGGIKSLKSYKAMQALWKHMAEELTGGPADANLIDTTNHANWLPRMMSNQLYETIKIDLPELTLFTEINMPGKVYDLPVLAGEREAMKVLEVTSISGANPFADTISEIFTPQKVTFTAQDQRARMLISGDAEEDLIINSMPVIERDMVRQHGEALADAIVNGQLVGGALDLRNNVDGHFGKLSGAGQAAWDARGHFRGLRKLAVDNSSVPDTHVTAGGATLSLATMRNARAPLREFGINPARLAYVLSITTYLKLLNEGNILTREKFGDLATVFTGVLAAVDGSPVVVSRRFPVNLDATGVIPAAGGGTLTGGVVVHRDAILIGNRRRMTVGRDVYGAMNVTDLYSFMRFDMKPLYADTVPYVGDIYNILN